VAAAMGGGLVEIAAPHAAGEERWALDLGRDGSSARAESVPEAAGASQKPNPAVGRKGWGCRLASRRAAAADLTLATTTLTIATALALPAER